ncbi:MAG: mannose-1-phosphate guanylyltransferase, partial [Candidatus Marinimicrobia bacterium]|nr:mannose-1-phosphate guanylyltransferase [Candidatus Neomarinimicrobiota bacterium]
ILESAKNVCVVRGDFAWSDVGSWDAVYEMEQKDKNGNVLRAEGACLKSSNNYIYATNAQVFTHNINDLIIIEDKGTILVLPRGESEKIKEIVDYLPTIGKDDLL